MLGKCRRRTWNRGRLNISKSRSSGRLAANASGSSTPLIGQLCFKHNPRSSVSGGQSTQNKQPSKDSECHRDGWREGTAGLDQVHEHTLLWASYVLLNIAN